MYRFHTDIKNAPWIERLPPVLHPYLYLARVDRPIGFWLLFLPCLWAFAVTDMWSGKRVFLFFLGSILMRSAGCVINDLADQSFDQRVERTKTRPLAAGKLSKTQALWFLTLLLGLAFLILIQLKKSTILMGIVFVPLVALYPLMKRWTYWPQLFLGIVFNGGILMVWIESFDALSLNSFLMYGASIFWTLGYDTIYGCQDMSDDLILGLKSTSLLFKNHLKFFLVGCFSSMILLLLILGVLAAFSNIYFGMILGLYSWFFYKAWFLDADQKGNLLQLFKNQKWVGLWVLCALLLGKI